MPNYWCHRCIQPRAECELTEAGDCVEVIRFLEETPDPEVPPSLVIKQSLKDRRQADAQAGTLGTQRDGFISGA